MLIYIYVYVGTHTPELPLLQTHTKPTHIKLHLAGVERIKWAKNLWITFPFVRLRHGKDSEQASEAVHAKMISCLPGLRHPGQGCPQGQQVEESVSL